jgi:hypothetical protein
MLPLTRRCHHAHPLSRHRADTAIGACEAALKKLDDVSPGRLRLLDWSSLETVVTRVEG